MKAFRPEEPAHGGVARDGGRRPDAGLFRLQRLAGNRAVTGLVVSRMRKRDEPEKEPEPERRQRGRGTPVPADEENDWLAGTSADPKLRKPTGRPQPGNDLMRLVRAAKAQAIAELDEARLEAHEELLAPFTDAEASAKAKSGAKDQQLAAARRNLVAQLNDARHSVTGHVRLVEEWRARVTRLANDLGALMDELGVPPKGVVREELGQAIDRLRRFVGQVRHPAGDMSSAFEARCEELTAAVEGQVRWRREPGVGPVEPVERPLVRPGTTKNWWLRRLGVMPRAGAGYVIVPLEAGDRPIHLRCDRDSVVVPPPQVWGDGADAVLACLFESADPSRRAHVTWTQGNQGEHNPHLYWGRDAVRFPEGFPADHRDQVTAHLARHLDACRRDMLARVRAALAELDVAGRPPAGRRRD